MENGLSNSSKRSLKISLRSPKRNLKKKPVQKKQWLSPTEQSRNQINLGLWTIEVRKAFHGPQNLFSKFWVLKICEIICQLGTTNATRKPKGLPANTGWKPQACAKSTAEKSNWKRDWLLLLADPSTASGVGSFRTMSLGTNEALSFSLTMKTGSSASSPGVNLLLTFCKNTPYSSSSSSKSSTRAIYFNALDFPETKTTTITGVCFYLLIRYVTITAVIILNNVFIISWRWWAFNSYMCFLFFRKQSYFCILCISLGFLCFLFHHSCLNLVSKRGISVYSRFASPPAGRFSRCGFRNW